MAKAQLDTADASVAFRAADQPGWHRDHLSERSRALSDIVLDSDQSAG